MANDTSELHQSFPQLFQWLASSLHQDWDVDYGSVFEATKQGLHGRDLDAIAAELAALIKKGTISGESLHDFGVNLSFSYFDIKPEEFIVWLRVTVHLERGRNK